MRRRRYPVGMPDITSRRTGPRKAVSSRSAIDTGYVGLILSGAREAGLDLDRLLARAGIRPEELEQPGTRLPQDQFARMIALLTRVTRDELWLLGSRPIKPGTFRMMCRLLIHCGSLRQAIRIGCQFYHLVVDDFVVRLAEGEHDASVYVTDTIEQPKRRRMVNGAILMFTYGLMCWLVGRRLPLITVHYVFPEEAFSSELEPVYRAPMLFDQPRTEIRFDAELLDLPIMPDEQRLRRFLASMPSALLVRYRDDASVAERVRGILRRNLKRTLSFEDVAGMVAMSPQTLRRRLLDEEQCGFQEIKDQVRRDVATHMLKKSRLPLEEVALSLGFSELSTFHRAFRRWTGMAPGEFRERHAANPAMRSDSAN
ncbi:AraC family transcriptional regulator [Rhodopseudomonas sp. HC1]|uniref:AraC family transcriptional regulator n=1 Tax=Rhodopseudomonas infernalis TaxID=2897386 RepID=UPI001EE95FBE|nr:AraC family transcriptional regulator [Rhodopseudomonas infernalis]MCG6203394.1 AraC family transcriptional regulator [Rhodopseudomonas infernalis]